MGIRPCFLISAAAMLPLAACALSGPGPNLDCPSDISVGRITVDTSRTIEGGGITECMATGKLLSEQQGAAYILCKAHKDGQGFQTAYSLDFRNGVKTRQDFCLMRPPGF